MPKKHLLPLLLLLLPSIAFAHPGITDESGGHHDYDNVSGLGSYHYHCGGHPAHLHENGICPYDSVSVEDDNYTDTVTDTTEYEDYSNTDTTENEDDISQEEYSKAFDSGYDTGYDCGSFDAEQEIESGYDYFDSDYDGDDLTQSAYDTAWLDGYTYGYFEGYEETIQEYEEQQEKEFMLALEDDEENSTINEANKTSPLMRIILLILLISIMFCTLIYYIIIPYCINNGSEKLAEYLYGLVQKITIVTIIISILLLFFVDE